MLSRKRHITLIIFLALILIIIVSEQIKGAYGDVKAPFLMERAVEAIIWADPKAGIHPTGMVCGNPTAAYIRSYTLVFSLARTEDIIPFLEHDAIFVRTAAHGTLTKRGEKAQPAIRRAYKTGSARIKLELFRIINPADQLEELHEEQVNLLAQIVEDDRLKVFYTDDYYITRYVYKRNGLSLDECPVDVVKLYLKMIETDFIPDKAHAIRGIGRLGDRAAPAVPTLIKILKGNNHLISSYAGPSLYQILKGKINRAYQVSDRRKVHDYYPTLHSEVISALGDIGPAALEAIPIIESKLDTNVYGDITNTRVALYKIGKDKEKHLSYIMDEFHNESPGDNMETLIRCLKWIGPDASSAIPKLINIAKTADRSFRNQALWAITSIEGSGETSRKIQLEGLKSEDPKLRAEYVQDLRVRHNDPERKATFFKMCKDPDLDVKYQAVSKLFSYYRERERLVPYLIEMINAEQQGVHTQYAADRIQDMKEFDFSAALPGMLNLLGRQKDYKFKSNIEIALKLGGEYEDIVAKLVENISSEDEEVAKTAIKHLGELGGNASDALLPLYKQYHTRGKHLDSYTKNAINDIVNEIGPGTDISPKVLITILDSLDHQQLRRIVNVLITKGTEFERIVPGLGQISKHRDTRLSNEAMKMLESHGDGSLSALPEMAGILTGNGDYIAGQTVLSILKSVTPETKGSVEDILPLLWSRNRKASYEAALAVFRMTGSYDAAADELINVLERGSKKQRKIALKTLGRIGGGAHKALPALQAEFRRLGPGYQLDVKRAITSIMTTIEPDENLNLDELLDSLEVGTDQNIKDAANQLIKATGEYQAVIDRLGEIALSENEQLRNRGFWALGGLETHQTEALLKLHELDFQSFQDRQGGAGYQIKTILQKINRGSDVDPDVVLKVMESPNQEVVLHGTQAYITLTGNYEPVVERLIELIEHEDENIQAHACTALARLKGKAAKALPALQRLETGELDKEYNYKKYAIDEITRGMR